MNRKPHDVMHRIVTMGSGSCHQQRCSVSWFTSAEANTMTHVCQLTRCLCSSTHRPRGVVRFRPVAPRFRPLTRPQWLYSVVCVSPDISYDGNRRSMGYLGLSFTRQCHHTYVIYLIYTPQPLHIRVLITFQDPREGIVILSSAPPPRMRRSIRLRKGQTSARLELHVFILFM